MIKIHQQITVDVDDNLVFDNLLSLHPEFKEISKPKYLKSKGKHRDDLFKFLFLYCDYRSNYYEYEDDERLEVSLSDAGLGIEDMDEQLNNAIAKYVELQESSPIVQTLRTATSALHTNNNLLKAFTREINKELDSDNVNTDLIEKSEKINKLINSIPKLLDTIKEVNDKIKKSMKEEEKGYGNQESGLFD